MALIRTNKADVSVSKTPYCYVDGSTPTVTALTSGVAHTASVSANYQFEINLLGVCSAIHLVNSAGCRCIRNINGTLSVEAIAAGTHDFDNPEQIMSLLYNPGSNHTYTVTATF